MEKHNVLEIVFYTLEDKVVAHIEQSLPMCNAKLKRSFFLIIFISVTYIQKRVSSYIQYLECS